MNLFKIFLDVCLLRAKPQDVPYSFQLLAVTAVTAVVSYILALEPAMNQFAQVLGTQKSIIVMSIAENAFFALTVWVIIRLRGRQERFVQAITAMFGASTLIRLVVWLIVGLLDGGVNSTGAGLAGILVLGLTLWLVIVYGHIFRNTLEITLVGGILYTIASLFVTAMLMTPVIGVDR